MPLTDLVRYRILRELDKKYQSLATRHYECAPRNGDIPIGGGDWMDCFFKMETIRGCMTALRGGKQLKEAIAEGKTVGEIGIRIWNGRREYQVHRWDKCCHDFIDALLKRVVKESTTFKHDAIEELIEGAMKHAKST